VTSMTAYETDCTSPCGHAGRRMTARGLRKVNVAKIDATTAAGLPHGLTRSSLRVRTPRGGLQEFLYNRCKPSANGSSREALDIDGIDPFRSTEHLVAIAGYSWTAVSRVA
jgi:hypothetical protein